MDNDFEIAPKFPRSKWVELRTRLVADMNNSSLWEEAYAVLNDRIESRYLSPIEKIKLINEESFSGEGFAITTILCALVEFLEALYQGINYEPNNPDNNKYQYKDSGEKFIIFLNSHEPFKSTFTDKLLAKDFYREVRCRLLHEASTGKSWRIRVDTNQLMTKEGSSYILNRDLFKKAIEEYLKNYKSELLSNTDRKDAFIRKFDHIADV